ncbi:uncharacterized protein [Amphiura filiformis]|uniref:uncharacterized protein n=1 Tax=Amphiura filiformis TaxID=82378 RepID=UPI003B212870
MDQKSSSEATSPCKKTSSIVIGILRSNQDTSSSLTISPVAQVEIPAKSQQVPRGRRRTRGTRTAYPKLTKEQIKALEYVFAANQYIGSNSREVLADALDMTEARVQAWFQNRRRVQYQAKRRASSSSASDISSSSLASEPHQMDYSPSFDHHESPVSPTSPETLVNSASQSQYCTQSCCSSPPIISTSASCSSLVNLSSYGLPQQYYGGAFTYAYYPHQYAYYYRPSGYTTVPSSFPGGAICSVPQYPPVARVEPVLLQEVPSAVCHNILP